MRIRRIECGSALMSSLRHSPRLSSASAVVSLIRALGCCMEYSQYGEPMLRFSYVLGHRGFQCIKAVYGLHFRPEKAGVTGTLMTKAVFVQLPRKLLRYVEVGGVGRLWGVDTLVASALVGIAPRKPVSIDFSRLGLSKEEVLECAARHAPVCLGLDGRAYTLRLEGVDAASVVIVTY